MQFLLRVARPDGEVDVRAGLPEVPRPEEAGGAVGEGQRQARGRVPRDEAVSGSETGAIFNFSDPF